MRRAARIAVAALIVVAVGDITFGGSTSASARGSLSSAAPSRDWPPAATASATPAGTVVIDEPADGQTTLDRTAIVRGRAPLAPPGGDVLTTVLVDGRQFNITGERGGAFTVPVTLAVGTNTIVATSEIDDADGGQQELTSPSVAINRQPGPTTGKLDRATALWVAEDSSAVYWLCGEGDGCLADPHCARISLTRVDCPVRWRFDPGDPVRCGLVVAVHVRGPRVYSYSYPCRGRWRGTGAFVRSAIVRTGRRYRVDEQRSDWLAYEINQRNRYGIPRFDVVRDEFIP